MTTGYQRLYGDLYLTWDEPTGTLEVAEDVASGWAQRCQGMAAVILDDCHRRYVVADAKDAAAYVKLHKATVVRMAVGMPEETLALDDDPDACLAVIEGRTRGSKAYAAI